MKHGNKETMTMKHGSPVTPSIIHAAVLLLIAAAAFDASAQVRQIVRGAGRKVADTMAGTAMENAAGKSAAAAARTAARESLRPAGAGVAIPAAGSGITDDIVKCFGNEVRGSLGLLNKDQSITMARFGGEFAKLPASERRKVVNAFQKKPAAFADKLRDFEVKYGKTGTLGLTVAAVFAATAGLTAGFTAGHVAGVEAGQDSGSNSGAYGWLQRALGALIDLVKRPIIMITDWVRQWVRIFLLAVSLTLVVVVIGPLKLAAGAWGLLSGAAGIVMGRRAPSVERIGLDN